MVFPKGEEKEGVLFSITETELSEPSRGMKGKRTHNNQVLRVRREAMNKKIFDFRFLLFIHPSPLRGTRPCPRGRKWVMALAVVTDCPPETGRIRPLEK